MKKSIKILSLALVMLGNVALASNVVNNTTKNAVSYEKSDVNPLCLAISKGDIATVKQIISYGIDVNDTTNRGMTPLMYAAIYNQSEIAALLLEKGADVNMKDKSGSTALDHAKTSGSNEVIEILKPTKKRK
ncbi:ankyrin repeat domain-containing protein [Flavobacterium ponti]|uniref:Ankyrin repeat domain-containing protein n=1 Tax=Flavobacterium ponti TaxID=665133 RepID=A0ABV9P6X8_9FLAO